MNEFRKLKIYCKSQARRWDYTTVPEIRLEGKWLDKLGFKKGDTVKVKMQDSKLTITVDKGQK
jgi:toxic protein SymE